MTYDPTEHEDEREERARFVYAKGVVVREQHLEFPCTWEELRAFAHPPTPLNPDV